MCNFSPVQTRKGEKKQHGLLLTRRRKGQESPGMIPTTAESELAHWFCEANSSIFKGTHGTQILHPAALTLISSPVVLSWGKLCLSDTKVLKSENIFDCHN